MDVLEFQEKHADVAFTLDFPIPPSMDLSEAQRRTELTVANARWAIENRRRKGMLLYACVQGWDLESYRKCAIAYSGFGFDGVAIGGLVPRVSDIKVVLKIVDAVRAVIPDKPLHVFGLGKPAIVRRLFRRGVQSVELQFLRETSSRWAALGSTDHSSYRCVTRRAPSIGPV